MGFGLALTVNTSIPTYSLINAIISSVCFISYLLTGRISPRKQEFSTTFKETISIIRKNCNLVVIICLSSTIIGLIYTYIGLLAVILKPEGISTQNIGLSGGFFVFSGIVGSSISNWISESRGIALSFRMFLVPSIAFCAGLVFSTSNFPAFSVLNVLTGFFIQGTMMISLSAISFNSFPADESIVSCIVYVLANLICLVCNYIIELVSALSGLTQLFTLALFNAAASIPLLIIYRQNKREPKHPNESALMESIS